MAASQPPAVVLMGPTAAGKTELALALCRRYPFDIISVDSALVYRGLEIGAARPDDSELARAPHRLINFRDPAQPYSAEQFRRDALGAMEQISAAGRIPLLVGGTMLYFKALRDGLARMPAADPVLRRWLAERARHEGWPALHRELQRVDPVTAARLHPNHSQRIQRALEVFHSTGRPLSVWQAEQHATALPYRLVQLALAPADRAELHRRIERRFAAMLERGLVEEVRALYRRGDLHAGLPAIRAVGYRQVWQYLEGEIGYDEMVARGVAATRQLAKRQLTWLRSWPDLNWIDGGGSPACEQAQNYLAAHSI